ncbi:hypothetical protein HFC70_05770 [Agrobacterium sp. a22-2]|nr:hypothetical protein [Agrobacterium sp. a22-2]
MKTTTRRNVLRFLIAPLVAFSILVGLPTAHGDVTQCMDIAQTHSAGEPASQHHQSDGALEACCSSMCVACLSVVVTLGTVIETEFSSSSFALSAVCLSGRTPSPGFEPPRSIA